MSSARRTKKATGVSSGASEQPGLRECVQKRLVKDVFEQASGTNIQAVMLFSFLGVRLGFSIHFDSHFCTLNFPFHEC